MASLREWITELFRSRYVAHLERENERLRIENRALMNSLLGHVGCPPIDIPRTELKPARPVFRPLNWNQVARRKEAESTVEAKKVAGEDRIFISPR